MAHWAINYTPECEANGSAICDGYFEDSFSPCTCPCHEANDLPQTIEGVKFWHDEFHGITDTNKD